MKFRITEMEWNGIVHKLDFEIEHYDMQHGVVTEIKDHLLRQALNIPDEPEHNEDDVFDAEPPQKRGRKPKGL
ncbi:MAG: hypothetical protein [Arizlama microvirus]|nr:MAG: hypothetical protein [Arizlama microvirus]